MYETTYSEVSEFIFLGISTYRLVRRFLLAFSTVFYVIIILGNLSIVLTVTLDFHLHSPIYFLLGNLSFIDLFLSTLTVPKMISDLFSGHNTISFQGCVIQMFLLHVLGASEMVRLIVAMERYLAICKPLHYLRIMSPRMCSSLLFGVWVIGLIHSVIQLAFVVHLPLCGPNEIDSFYCDLPYVIKLACIDTYRMEFLVTANSGLISVGTFFVLLISFTFILFTVWKHSAARLHKAFSTLSAPISVVVLFFGPCIFVYMWPFPIVPVDKLLAILGFMITPILNPAMYTLRNKDMKLPMRRFKGLLMSLKRIS
ncbi:olfactory receptor 4F15-like [Perognathus longimembris pacificus]|uniref:olfactory receptor 4F15-like n=1 Tax=Perognathus longimembris pacificus TaxID=214514 RepID=UPI0020198ECD|nr:olfactory receptor 4F15-like [Perognathus longimembris pacificus]